MDSWEIGHPIWDKNFCWKCQLIWDGGNTYLSVLENSLENGGKTHKKIVNLIITILSAAKATILRKLLKLNEHYAFRKLSSLWIHENIAIQELKWIVALSKGMLAHEHHFLIIASFPLPLSTKWIHHRQLFLGCRLWPVLKSTSQVDFVGSGHGQPNGTHGSLLTTSFGNS